MSQTVTVEQTVAAPQEQSITIKLNASSSNENDPKTQTLNDLVNAASNNGNESLESACEKLEDLLEKDTDAQKDVESFLEGQETRTLLVIVKAAHKLNMKRLVDILWAKIADQIKYMKVEEVRELFNITNDFTPQEEQAICDEHPWAFEEYED